ncbi:MAG: hypothetical protein Fur0025_44080 [Oscillatoriaceae cyanobacterium]
MKSDVQTAGIVPVADIGVNFWQEWEKYKDYLYRCCLKWMGNPTDAEDALSQAMLKAYSEFQKSANRIDNLKAWLTQLTRNLCLDIHREIKRRALPVADFEGIVAEEKLASQEETPVRAARRRELELFLKNAINQLPPRLRETLVLFVYQEKSYQEIATELNISYDNVRQRICKARAILRQQLQEYEGGEVTAPVVGGKGSRGDGGTRRLGDGETGGRGDGETESRGNPPVVAPEQGRLLDRETSGPGDENVGAIRESPLHPPCTPNPEVPVVAQLHQPIIFTKNHHHAVPLQRRSEAAAVGPLCQSAKLPTHFTQAPLYGDGETGRRGDGERRSLVKKPGFCDKFCIFTETRLRNPVSGAPQPPCPLAPLLFRLCWRLWADSGGCGF